MVVRCKHIRKGESWNCITNLATRMTARCGPHRGRCLAPRSGARPGQLFALYRVEAAYLDEALRLDAQEVKPADDVAWAAIVEAAVVADGYSRAEYEAVFMPSDVLPEMEHAVAENVRRIPVDWIEA
jgi:hypothetical protein